MRFPPSVLACLAVSFLFRSLLRQPCWWDFMGVASVTFLGYTWWHFISHNKLPVPLAPTTWLPLLLLWPQSLYRSCVVDISVGARLQIIICPRYLDHLWFSVMVSICCKGKLCGWGVRTTKSILRVSSWSSCYWKNWDVFVEFLVSLEEFMKSF